MNTNPQNRLSMLIQPGALLLIIIFWVFYGVLSFYNRFATDDYSMIALANHRGVVGGTIWFYFNWSGGVFGTFFQTLTLALVQGFRSLLLYNLFLLTFISLSLFTFTRQIIRTYALNLTNLQNFIIGQLLIQALFFSGFSISENWFWVVGSTGYLYSIAILFISLSFFLRYRRLNQWHDLAFSALLIFIFGSYSVNYCATFVAITGIVFALDFIKERKLDYPAIGYVVAMIAGTVVNVLAPGNWKRMQATALDRKNVVTPTFAHEIATVPLLIFKKLLLTKMLYVLIFCLPVIWLLTQSSNNNRALLTKWTLLFGVFLFVSVILNVLIMYKAMGWGMGGYRSLLHISLLFVFLIVAGGWLMATRFAVDTVLKAGALLAIVAGVYLNMRTLYTQLPVVKKYARAHDERTDIILQAKAGYTGKVLCLDSLPNPGLLLTAEMGGEANNYINVDMKSRFDLPFDMAVKGGRACK